MTIQQCELFMIFLRLLMKENAKFVQPKLN